jgi:alpha-L-fucosidase
MKKKEKRRYPWNIISGCATLLVFLGVLFFTGCSSDQSGSAGKGAVARPELLPEEQVRLSNDPGKTEIFRDAGLGLFIHWGPNSQMGTEISWPLNNASDDYVEKYYGLARTFDPFLFDPAGWAKLAKLSGIEYVVFTSKHHDGFAMFDTAYSDLKITNTPYKKDIVGMIAEAFRREGILVGFYYSPGDFRYQWETGRRPHPLMAPDFESDLPFGPQQKSFVEYECGQVEELLTNYGDVFMLWFDGMCDPLKKHAWRIRQDVFIGRGEIPTPEQNIPGEAADHAWESCMTTSWQWSYQPNPDIRTAREIIDNLIRIRARGGNMLLNVGPRPDGRIASADEELLRELGLFMMISGEGIRAVRPWKVTNEGDVWLTKKKDENTVYAFCPLTYGLPGIEAHAGCRFTLKSVKTTPETSVSVLGQDGGCLWADDTEGLHITFSRIQTVQFIKTPPLAEEADPSLRRRAFVWGPDWPVAVKITHVRPQ